MYAIIQDVNPPWRILKPLFFFSPVPLLPIGHLVNVLLVLFVGQQSKSMIMPLSSLSHIWDHLSRSVLQDAPKPPKHLRNDSQTFFQHGRMPTCAKANDYASKFALPIHKSITRNIKELLRLHAISLEQFNV